MKPSHRPKKAFGQNFLVDRRIQQKIIDNCQLQAADTVVEIGPGKGAITRLIAPKVKQVFCIEKDRDLIGPLQEEFQGSNVQIICADFLKWDLGCHSRPRLKHSGVNFDKLKIVGNIPYYISTPILEKLIADRRHITQAYLTVQLEFGQRLAAKSGGKDFGALSCFVQYWADVRLLFKIKNTCFRPAPKVDSCFVCLDFTRPPVYQPADEQFLFRLIRTAFTQRRKTLLNALSAVAAKDRLAGVLEQLRISPTVRPEQLNLQNFVDISNRLG